MSDSMQLSFEPDSPLKPVQQRKEKIAFFLRDKENKAEERKSTSVRVGPSFALRRHNRFKIMFVWHTSVKRTKELSDFNLPQE